MNPSLSVTKNKLLGLKSLGHGHGDLVTGKVVGLARGVPSDAREDRDHALVENLLQRLRENLLDPAGVLESPRHR